MISTFRIANSMDISTKAEDQESIRSVVVKTKDRVAVRKEIAMLYSGSAAMSRVKNSVIRKNPSPCKDCTARHSGCHSECSLYSEWKNAVHQKKTKILKNYAKANSGSREAKARTRRYVERKADMSKKGQTVTI